MAKDGEIGMITFREGGVVSALAFETDGIRLLALYNGVSADLLHGFGRFMLQINRTSRLAALEVHGEAMTPVDTAAYARRYARAPAPITSTGLSALGGTAVGLSHPRR